MTKDGMMRSPVSFPSTTHFPGDQAKVVVRVALFLVFQSTASRSSKQVEQAGQASSEEIELKKVSERCIEEFSTSLISATEADCRRGKGACYHSSYLPWITD